MTEYIKKRKRGKRKEPGKISLCAVLVIMIVSLVLIVLLMLFLCAFPSVNPVSFWITVGMMVFLLVVLLIAILSESKSVIRISQKVKQRESMLKLIITVCFGVVITGAINVAALSFSQAQYELADRTTLPHFTLVAPDPIYPGLFELSSSVGTASAVSLEIKDRCYFQYDGVPCEINVIQPTRIMTGPGTLDVHNRILLFGAGNPFVQYEDAKEIIKNKVSLDLLGADYISVGRCYEVSFFDYQNQGATYHFTEHENSLELSSTTSHHFYENNTSVAVFDINPYEQAVDQAIDSLMSRFSYSDELYVAGK